MRKQFGWEMERRHCRWCFYFWRTQWTHISFGIHIDIRGPNVELHVPFGFVRVGRIENMNVSGTREVNIAYHMARLEFWKKSRC